MPGIQDNHYLMMKSNNANSSAHNRAFSWLGAVVALGIVFGDIGTSPLYVMKAIINAGDALTPDYIIGAVSCIIWTLTLQTTVKYVLMALRADNNGEGGILALYALLHKKGRPWLYILAIIGAGTLIADGVITPSITVLSAIEGLKVYEPETPVIPICLCIIAVLFFIQQFGTNAIGKLFGPLMLLWFSMMGVLGVAALGHHFEILKAFNPYYAVRLLLESPEWFLILGAVFLCTTGAEALYSDLGHCGIRNIRVSWAFVKSMLVLNYLGQGAWVIAHATSMPAGTNPFYAMMPREILFFGIAMATVAAIIASQALISGSFTIFSEAMNLKFWPRQRIKHPTSVKGQLYIPFVNHALFVLCVAVILFFQSSEKMEAAYGLSITVTMLMTTLLLGAYLLHWHKSKLWVVPVIGFFVVLESVFLVANLFKFVHGGWVTMLLAGVIILIMYVWYNATEIRNSQVKAMKVKDYYRQLTDIKNDESIAKFATNVIYMSKLPKEDEVEQKIMYSIINKHPIRADHYFLMHVEYQDEPDTLEYKFVTLIPGTLYRLNLKLGFRIQPYVNLYFREVIEDLVASGEFSLDSAYSSLRKHGIAGNFIFFIINRLYSTANPLSKGEHFVMMLYNIVSKMEQSIPDALGLDTSNVRVENVPLIVRSTKTSADQRIKRIKEKEKTAR